MSFLLHFDNHVWNGYSLLEEIEFCKGSLMRIGDLLVYTDGYYKKLFLHQLVMKKSSQFL